MKIRIEHVEDIPEDEIVIRCREPNEQVEAVYRELLELPSQTPELIGYKGSEEYRLPLRDILFFETDADAVFAHTVEDAYRVKLRLYELETMLPPLFIRVSKSTILNITQIYSIDRGLTTGGLIRFYKSHKQVYVSRFYFKRLRQRLDERSHHEA